MGCSTSAPAVSEANSKRTLSANKVSDNATDSKSKMGDQENSGEKDTYPASEAYIIPLSDDAETKVYTAGAPEAEDLLAATVKKQPPKRIQELMEQAAENETATLNLQDLEEKLEKAEERRKEYLQQKITTIQKTTQMLTRSGSKELLDKLETTQIFDGKAAEKDNPADKEAEKK
ncbi:uncharacterized protein LOC105226834 [Bactrocera dorsalis]|uniref:Uncharacterized protein LOC105226834 n=1 Tax=Bactrocera dorsalis TaxID=27457 RepID=A0A6I9V638_BACDO|nr:uncharacterized protein LOC105226834 [Bactrocera dorsalis]XP_029406335.2 uncharacterized protein LOC105226834 [Bactrocera dorsalis]XP_029406336.2 uncharacterized protein LOC105226834 [Bactrocera dorsalis]XP_049309462.1 uncharacterized protein LOC105226834 [Bactrocera dorsalis]